MTYGCADSASEAPAPGHSTAVVDLLGLLAYAELVSFFRLAEDAELAPTLEDKGELAGLAATEYTHYKRVRDRLSELGVQTQEAMGPFVEPLDAWHARTKPQSWLESLVKVYVGDGITGDFYRKLAERADDDTRALAQTVLSETGRGEFIVARVRAAVADDPALAGRLSLWARRLVGEALSQAQAVAATRVELADLFASEGDGAEVEAEGPAAVSRIFAKLTDTHNTRLEAMGLSS